MRLFVTGGSGFLGRRVVEQALSRGHQVTCLARGDQAELTVRARGADVVRGDLDDAVSVDGALRTADADALLSIASLGFGHAETIVEAAARAGLRRAVFLSTTGIFTTLDPPSKKTRLEAEQTIRASDLDWTIIRPTMIYGGPDDRNMWRLLALVHRSPVVPMPGGGRALQQPVHVDDLAATVLNAVERDRAVRRCYDVAGPTAITFQEIVTAAGAAVGRQVIRVPVPVAPVRVAVRAYERRGARPRLRSEQIVRLTEPKSFDISAARRDLGHLPREFADGIRAEAALIGIGGAHRARGPRGRGRATSELSRAGRLPAVLARAGRPGILLLDLARIGEVAGPSAAGRFAVGVVRHARQVRTTGTLTAADRFMTGRHWTFRPLDGVEVTLPGEMFGAAREMYCRRVYCALPGYAPTAGEVVVDLGANRGLFSLLAARAGADVIAVEAQRGFAPILTGLAEENGVSQRIQLLPALVGAGSGVLADRRTRHAASHWAGEVETLELHEVFERGGVNQADLVKMDIEGSEFALFDEPDWLGSVDRLVLEVHTEHGSPSTLLRVLDDHGFETALLDNALLPTADLNGAASGYLYARRRRSTAPAPVHTAGVESMSTEQREPTEPRPAAIPAQASPTATQVEVPEQAPRGRR